MITRDRVRQMRLQAERDTYYRSPAHLKSIHRRLTDSSIRAIPADVLQALQA